VNTSGVLRRISKYFLIIERAFSRSYSALFKIATATRSTERNTILVKHHKSTVQRGLCVMNQLEEQREVMSEEGRGALKRRTRTLGGERRPVKMLAAKWRGKENGKRGVRSRRY